MPDPGNSTPNTKGQQQPTAVPKIQPKQSETINNNIIDHPVGNAIFRGMAKSVSVPKPRSLYAFLIDVKRWQVPRSLDQLKNRLRTNVLFFQTNYFVLAMLCFVLFTILSLKAIVTGLVSGVLIALAIAFFTDYLPQAREIKQNHPTVVIVTGVILIILAWNSLHTIILVTIALTSSFPICLGHACLRDSSNLTSGSESSKNYFSTTPVGRVMALLGFEATASANEQRR